MIYSYRHPKHWSNVQPWNPPGRLEPFEGSLVAEALKQLPKLVERLKITNESFIKNVNIQDFLEFPADADPEHSNEFKVQRTLEALSRNTRLKSMTAIKPDRAPPRLLTDTCEGIHPTFTKDYIRRTTSAIDKINVPNLVDVIRKSVEAAGLEVTKP